MKNYELLCVIPGTLAEDEVTPIIAQVKDVLASAGATNVSVEDRGKSRLAHPIKHIRYGYFHLIQFEAEGTAIEQMTAKFRIMPELLRAFITMYNPELRAQKDKKLAEVLTQEVSKKKPAGKKGEVVASEEADADEATDKPTEEAMEKIEEKLDQVLDSALKEV